MVRIIDAHLPLQHIATNDDEAGCAAWDAETIVLTEV